jgi:hypothetical protein
MTNLTAAEESLDDLVDLESQPRQALAASRETTGKVRVRQALPISTGDDRKPSTPGAAQLPDPTAPKLNFGRTARATVVGVLGPDPYAIGSVVKAIA